MFGYVIPDKMEMKIKEYELYKAYYCGICRSIKKRHGNIPRLSLTYDSTFLAILLSSIDKEKFNFKLSRCAIHPVKKQKIIIDNNSIDYAADMNILLSYFKFKDNRRDEKSKISLLGLFFFKKAFKNIYSKYNNKCVIISSRLDELTAQENIKAVALDAVAEPFAKLMEELFVKRGVSEKNEKVLRWLGYNLGKWIYTIDAFDDIDKDFKNKSFNPFLGESVHEVEKTNISESIEPILFHMLSEIAKSYELLDIKRNRGILDNIIYSGMKKKTEQILEKGSCIQENEPI
jgi:hypothetical protein